MSIDTDDESDGDLTLAERERLLDAYANDEITREAACERLGVSREELRKSVELRASAAERGVPAFVTDSSTDE